MKIKSKGIMDKLKSHYKNFKLTNIKNGFEIIDTDTRDKVYKGESKLRNFMLGPTALIKTTNFEHLIDNRFIGMIKSKIKRSRDMMFKKIIGSNNVLGILNCMGIDCEWDVGKQKTL